MRRQQGEQIDLSVYARAFGVYARNPTVFVLPLLAAVIGVLVAQVASGGLMGSLLGFVLLLLQLFALGVSIIIADAGWRSGLASFDEAWADARRKGGDILFAAFGFTFVLSIAQYAGQILGALSLVLTSLAVYALIYAIPAAAIGGVPGNAAIGVSIERVRQAPITAAILTVVAIVLLVFVGPIVAVYVSRWLGEFGGTGLVASLTAAFVHAILAGYFAIVAAKVYADVSFTMPRW